MKMVNSVSSFGSETSTPVTIFQNCINSKLFYFVCPFSIQYDFKTDKFALRKSLLRKVIVATVFIMVLILIICGETGRSMLSKSSVKKSTFEQWLSSLGPRIWELCVIYIEYFLWFKGEHILKFCNDLQVVCQSLKGHGITLAGQKSWAVSVVLTIFAATWLVVESVFSTYKIDSSNYSYEYISRAVVSYSKEVLYGDFNWKTTDQDEYTATECITAIACFIISVLSCKIFQFSFLLMAVLSTTVWLTTRNLTTHVQNADHNAKELKMVLTSVTQLCKALDSFAQCFGALYGTSCLAFIIMLAIHLPFLFTKANLAFQLGIGIHLVLFAGVVFPAAEVHSKLKTIPLWIQYSYLQEKNQIDSKNLEEPLNGYTCTCLSNENEDLNEWKQIVVQQIHGNNVGLSGNLFIITYGLLGNIFGLIVTYAVIIVQLKSS